MNNPDEIKRYNSDITSKLIFACTILMALIGSLTGEFVYGKEYTVILGAAGGIIGIAIGLLLAKRYRVDPSNSSDSSDSSDLSDSSDSSDLSN